MAAKTIRFEYEGKPYTLEFNRKTVKQMENAGFDPTELAHKPMTMLPQLFAGAFLKNHKYTKQDVIDKIFDHIADKEQLIGKLAEMYNEPLEALLNADNGEEGNVTWTAD